MPLAIVQILSWILIWPAIFWSIFPDLYHYIFTKEVLSPLQWIAWIGVISFIWLSGLEIHFIDIHKNKKDTFITAGLWFLFPLIIWALFSFLLSHFDGWMGQKATVWQFVLVWWLAVSVTALPILALFLEKYGILRKELWQRIMRYAAFDDIFIWTLLSIILLQWNKIILQVLFFIGLFICTQVMYFVLWKMQNKQEKLVVWLLWMLFISFFADYSGLHFIVWAFLAWVVLPISHFWEENIDSLRKFVLLLLMPVFFLLTGIKTNWELWGIWILVVWIIFSLIAIWGRILWIFAASKLLKWKTNDTSLIWWFLQTKGLIEVIFISILLERQIISSATFTALLIMAIISTCLTQPMTRKHIKWHI
jgi:Kef-type K+ transport system membrane component KefB